MGIMQHRGPSG